MQPYYVRDSMLDPVEQSLYRSLTLVLCQRALLFTKITLRDLVMAPTSTQAKNDWERLAHQRVDFVLCDRNSMRPIGVILFAADPASPEHEDADQLAQICAKAGLSVMRLQRQSTYFMHQLTPVVESLLNAVACCDDFTNGDRLTQSPGHGTTTMRAKGAYRRKQPAYPGYGALKTIAGKLA